MNFHCNKLIHSVSNSAKPIFLTISTKSYFCHSEVFPFPCCIRWSLFPYILRGSFSKSKIHPGNTEIHFMDLLSLPGRDLDGDFAFPIPSILTSTMSFWLPLKWAHHETVSEGTTDPFSWFHSVERTCFERKGGVCLERKNQKNIFIKIWSV